MLSAERRRRVTLSIILFVAIIVRLGFWFAVVGFDTAGWGDEPDYHAHALDISEGRGFLSPKGEVTAYRPPLYPIVLAGLYSITGPDPDAARALQVILGGVIVLLVYALATQLFSVRVGLVAAALAAVNPGLVYMSALIMTENLYVILMLLMLMVLVREWRNPRGTIGGYVLAGVLAGLCSLTRPTAFTVALLMACVTLVFARERFGTRFRQAAVYVLLTVAVVLPWSIRNYVQMDAWVTFTTHGGITFYESNNMLNYEVPEFRGIVVLPRRAVPDWDKISDLPEVEHDRAGWRMGIEFIREHPREFSRMAWWKFCRFWRVRSGLNLAGAAGVEGSGSSALARLASRVDIFTLYWIPVLSLFVLGLFATAKHHTRLAPLYTVLAGHVLLAMLFHGSLRARMPIEAIISIFAAAALVAIVMASGRRAAAAR
jgi:4-amino-4-deoxy-L-arabinose transferase-like glycosyltransferase